MSLWGAFTGSAAKNQAAATKTANDGYANAGATASQGFLKQGYDASVGRMQPYADGGRRGYDQYNNMLGLGGAGAQQGAMAAYQAANPYQQAEQQRLMQAGDRRAAATGQFNSGLGALARARTSDEVANRNYQQYMGQLQGMGQQGMQASGAMAGYDQNYAQGRVGVQNAQTGQLTGNQNAYNTQWNQGNQAFAQNLMGVAGLGLQAGGLFKPTGGFKPWGGA